MCPAGIWASRQSEGWTNFYWAWLNLGCENKRRKGTCLEANWITPLCFRMFIFLFNFCFPFSARSGQNWKCWQPGVRLTAPWKSVPPQTDQGEIWVLAQLVKSSQDSPNVAYSTRMDGHFLYARKMEIVLGNGDSKMVKTWPSLISQDLQNWCQKEYIIK